MIFVSDKDEDIALAIPLFENDEIFKKIKKETSEESQLLVTTATQDTSLPDREEVTIPDREEVTIPNVFKNLPTLSTNRRNHRLSTNFVEHGKDSTSRPPSTTNKKIISHSLKSQESATKEGEVETTKSYDVSSLVTEPTLSALNIHYNTIIRQETTSMATPPLTSNNDKSDLITKTTNKPEAQTPPATSTRTSPVITTISKITSSLVPTSVTNITTSTAPTSVTKGTSPGPTSVTNTTTSTAPTSVTKGTSPAPTSVTKTTTSPVITSVTKAKTLTSRTPLTSSTTQYLTTIHLEPNSYVLTNSDVQRKSLNSTTTEIQITEPNEKGKSFALGSDGQETAGEVKQIKRDQRIDDLTSEIVTTSSTPTTILSDELVNAVQGGITSQVLFGG